MCEVSLSHFFSSANVAFWTYIRWKWDDIDMESLYISIFQIIFDLLYVYLYVIPCIRHQVIPDSKGVKSQMSHPMASKTRRHGRTVLVLTGLLATGLWGPGSTSRVAFLLCSSLLIAKKVDRGSLCWCCVLKASYRWVYLNQEVSHLLWPWCTGRKCT